jgi:hypothetical protein
VLPGRVRLQSLGAVSLPGLPAPEELFQVMAPGLPQKFPKLRMTDPA